MPNGMITIVKVGVAMMTTIIVLRIRKAVKKKVRMDLGMTSSMM